MDERSPATALYGLAMALGGFILLLCATGVVPVGDGFFNAPRWIMAPVALLITAGGAYMLAAPFTTDAQRASFGAALALAFITIMGVLLTWILLTGRTGRGSLAVAGIVIPLPARAEVWLNRFFVGAFALGIDAIAIYAWWRVLTKRRSPSSA